MNRNSMTSYIEDPLDQLSSVSSNLQNPEPGIVMFSGDDGKYFISPINLDEFTLILNMKHIFAAKQKPFQNNIAHNKSVKK